MRLQITFSVEVTILDEEKAKLPIKQIGRLCIEESVAEAIREAVVAGENRGFNHELEDEIAIVLRGPVEAEFVKHELLLQANPPPP